HYGSDVSARPDHLLQMGASETGSTGAATMAPACARPELLHRRCRSRPAFCPDSGSSRAGKVARAALVLPACLNADVLRHGGPCRGDDATAAELDAFVALGRDLVDGGDIFGRAAIVDEIAHPSGLVARHIGVVAGEPGFRFPHQH